MNMTVTEKADKSVSKKSPALSTSDVLIGDTVLWFVSPGVSPSPAVVTSVGQNFRTLSLAILHPNHTNIDPRDGVFHVGDKDVHPADSDSGLWDFTDSQKKLHETLIALSM